MDYANLGLKIIPDFISIKEETELLNHIQSAPPANKKNAAEGRNTIKRYGSSKPYNSDMVSVIYLNILILLTKD